jgi:hypothetical protein
VQTKLLGEDELVALRKLLAAMIQAGKGKLAIDSTLFRSIDPLVKLTFRKLLTADGEIIEVSAEPADAEIIAVGASTPQPRVVTLPVREPTDRLPHRVPTDRELAQAEIAMRNRETIAREIATMGPMAAKLG